MLHSIIWYVKFVVALLLKIPALKKGDKLLKEKGQAAYDRYVYDISTAWALARLRDSGAKITVHHPQRIPQDRNVVFISNHQSDFDIAIFMAEIHKDTGFVAKMELSKVPFLRDWMKAIHCVFMDRNDLRQSLETILEGIKLVKQGYSLVIFPEGTRSRTGKMGEFKAGAFKLATKPKATIVPVTINGSRKIMEANHYRITPAQVDVIIHEPVDTSVLSKEELSELPQKLHAIIEAPLLERE